MEIVKLVMAIIALMLATTYLVLVIKKRRAK